jgi:hypothetical protein
MCHKLLNSIKESGKIWGGAASKVDKIAQFHEGLWGKLWDVWCKGF